MVQMLALNGVKHIFGLSGDTSLPFHDAMARLPHGIDHVLTGDALNLLVPDDSIVLADPGTPRPYFSASWNSNRSGRQFITNRAYGALGFSMAAGVGASIGRPNATVVSVMGDGSFGFTCGELETIVRRKLPLKMIIFSNSAYRWIKASQNAGDDKRYFPVDFNCTEHARVAEAFSVKAWRIEDPAQLDDALKATLAHDGPALSIAGSSRLREPVAHRITRRARSEHPLGWLAPVGPTGLPLT